MWFHSFLLSLIVIGVIFEIKSDKHLNTLISISILLLILLFYVRKSHRFEFFDTEIYPNHFDKLYEIPTYMETVIGKGIDKLIKATKPDMSGAQDQNQIMEMTYLSPEFFGDDPDLQGEDGNMSLDKYNLLIGEYLKLDTIFQKIHDKYPETYQKIFQ